MPRQDQKSYAPTTARSLIRSALPIGAFYLTEILVGLTDLAVVGALGATELAAVGLGKTILLSIMVVGFAVLSIGMVLMAEHPTPDNCGSVVAASMVVAVPFVLVAVLVGRYFGDLLAASGYAPELVAAFDNYASVLAWAIAPALVFAALKNVLNAVDRTGAITWLSIGIVLGNLVGSIILVHGGGAWPGLGLVGAALATTIVYSVAAALLLVHVLRAGVVDFQHLRVRAITRAISEIIHVGWAAGAQQGLESVLFIVVLYLLGLQSTHWLAAGTLVFAVMEINYAMSGAIGEVLAARIAATRTAGTRSAHRLLRLGAGVSGGAAAALALTVGLFAEAVVDVFSISQSSLDARALMVELLRFTVPLFLFDAWQITFVYALRGMRWTALPMILSTVCYWLVGLGGGATLASAAGLGALGVWIGFCAGLTCAAGLLAAMAFYAAGRSVQGA